jgi:hypothetical protein
LSREARVRFQNPHFVAQYTDSLVQQDVFGIFPRFFGRQLVREITLVSLQPIILARTTGRWRCRLVNRIFKGISASILA